MFMLAEKNGCLYIDGCKIENLADKYGTPLYIYSKEAIDERISELKNGLYKKYNKFRAAYAAKAFFPKEMARIINQAGLCIDVVSAGELYTAMAVDFPAERIEFNGNNKLRSELEMAIDYGVGRIIIDGLDEIRQIEEICQEKGKKTKVLIRLTPGVPTSTHDYIITGKKDSKFGLELDEQILLPAIEKILKSENIELYGFHFHIGSQLFDVEPYLDSLEEVLKMVGCIYDKVNYIPKEINVGGGFGVQYTDEERKPYSYFLEPVIERIVDFYQKKSWENPNIVIEPGRSIVGEAGITVYKTGDIKDIKGVRKYVSVDGGMTDNIRPALYQAEYKACLVKNSEDRDKEKVTICGKCCESGDVIIKDIELPKIKSGDLIAVLTTGAYGYSMASNYNKLPIPAVVMTEREKEKLIVKRQSFEDICSNEL